MRDITARAGVSVKTVSRVVNGEPHIRPETQRQVREAIDALDRGAERVGTHPDAQGRTGVVAIVVAERRRPTLEANAPDARAVAVLPLDRLAGYRPGAPSLPATSGR